MLLYNKVKFNELIMFYRQFAVMLKAGISISDCLHNLEKQNFSKAFKKETGLSPTEYRKIKLSKFDN